MSRLIPNNRQLYRLVSHLKVGVSCKYMCHRQFHRLYVRDLAEETTSSTVFKFYSKFGSIRDFVFVDEASSSPRQAVVCFQFREEAAKAMFSLPHTIDGKQVVISYTPSRFTLFVSQLNPTTTENGLQEYFSQFGPVDEIKLVRDKDTKRSCGFAYVSYYSQQALQKALETKPHLVDNHEVHARLLRAKDCTMFVGLLAANTTEQSLKNYFARFGTVIYTRIRKDPATGQSRCCGYVSFAAKKELEAAVATREHEIDGKSVTVTAHSSSGCRLHRSSQTTLFLKNLSPNTDEDSLEKFYSRYGFMLENTLLRDPASKRSRNCAFVSYSAKEEAESALKSRPHTLDGKVIEVYPHDPLCKLRGKTLLVGRLPIHVTSRALLKFYSRFGGVLNCKIRRDQTRRTGFLNALVYFTSNDGLNKALSYGPHKFGSKIVSIRKAYPVVPTHRKEIEIARRSLFLPNLALHTTQHSLRQFFSEFGVLTQCKVVKKDSKHFGFVTFSSKKELAQALAANPHVIDGKKVQARIKQIISNLTGLKRKKLEPNRPKIQAEIKKLDEYKPIYEIFVCKLSEDTTKLSLLSFYEKFGKVVRCKLALDQCNNYNSSKKYALVAFGSRLAYARALTKKPVMIDGKTVIQKPSHRMALENERLMTANTVGFNTMYGLQLSGLMSFYNKNNEDNQEELVKDSHFSVKISMDKWMEQNRNLQCDLNKNKNTATSNPHHGDPGQWWNNAQKVNWAKEHFEKQIPVKSILAQEMIDCIGVTKGTRFKGVISRWHTKKLHRKTHKDLRNVACIGAWHPSRVQFTVARAGQKGYHHRIEINKKIYPWASRASMSLASTMVPTNSILQASQSTQCHDPWPLHCLEEASHHSTKVVGEQTKRFTYEEIELKWIDTSSKFGHGQFQTLAEKKAFMEKLKKILSQNAIRISLLLSFMLK
uniref:RRM domain-containing protein n=1 Tax=Ditylenchus dipsaci TaxID=166011 RepID=A0A915CUR6_9BILA